MNKIKSFSLIAVLCFVLICSCAEKKDRPLKIVEVKRGSIVSSIPATGTVMPRNRLEIKPPISGRIEAVLLQEGAKVKKGQVLAWLSSLERAALIDAARAKGAEEVKKWEELYKPTPVIAPIDGFIIRRNVEPGQTLTANDSILVMADQLIVKAQIDETDIGHLKINQNATIVLDAYPNYPIAGKIEHIAYESKVVNNVTVYEVDVIPQEIPSFFRSGMSATINFLQAEKENVLIIPIRSVKISRNNPYVFKVKENGEAEPIQIETGLKNSENIEVISGLKEGDKLAIPTEEMLKKLSPRRGGPMIISPFGRQRQ